MSRDLVRKLTWTSLVMALVTSTALAIINAHLRNEAAPQGIVSFGGLKSLSAAGRCTPSRVSR